MKRFVPLVVATTTMASIAINCSGGGHHPPPINPNGKLVCGDVSKTVVHQLKYVRGPDNQLTQDIDGSCPWPCPGNSPLVNSFPIDGLAADGTGTCTPEGVRVDPGTAGDSACGMGNLQFAAFTHKDDDEIDGRLQIRNSAGATCGGSDLVGTSFTVSSNDGSATLTITDVITIPYSGSGASASKHPHEAYRIVATFKGDTAGSGVSVCDPARSVAVRAALGLPDMSGDYSVNGSSGSTSGSADPYADYAIAVPGPLYSVYVRPLRNTADFFNLACASDALAKVTLDKVATKSESDDKHYAALRMMTATYCYKPRTTRNRLFHYENGGKQQTGSANKETWWDAVQGARCLEHPRLEELGEFKDVQLGSDLVPPACGSDYGHEKCADWKAYTAAVRNECAGSGVDDTGIPSDECKESDSGMDYKSYLPIGSGASPSAPSNAGQAKSGDKVVRWIKP